MEREGAVSANALAKSGRVLYAFSSFYFPFYGRRAAELFYRFDPYAWISAYIYEIDEAIESGEPLTLALSRLEHLRLRLHSRLPGAGQLESLIEDAHQYYAFEYRLLHHVGSFDRDDLENMTARRSFDFRLMHRILAYDSNGSFCEPLFSWFRYFEVMMEIEDDISSIEKDRERETFNVAVLAARLDAQSANAFVETMRERVDERLKTAQALLTPEHQPICEQVLSAYRKIVNRPELPEFALERSRENS